MARLLIYGVLLGFFSDVLRRALIVQAETLLLPLVLILVGLVVLSIRQWRRLLAKRTERNPRPPSKWPEQTDRPIR